MSIVLIPKLDKKVQKETIDKQINISPKFRYKNAQQSVSRFNVSISTLKMSHDQRFTPEILLTPEILVQCLS